MDSENNAVMTIDEVADYLRLAPSTVYKLVRQKKLPGRKVGGKWRFSQKSLNHWLEHPGEEQEPLRITEI